MTKCKIVALLSPLIVATGRDMVGVSVDSIAHIHDSKSKMCAICAKCYDQYRRLVVQSHEDRIWA